MKPIQLAATVFLTIIGAGAVLNLAGQGKLGSTAQQAARYVTDGYGSISS
jgi:hypothetical protein